MDGKLDGKPVVDEGVIEAIAGDVFTTPGGRNLISDILRKHLCPSKQEQGAEEKLPPIERIEAVAAVIEERDRLKRELVAAAQHHERWTTKLMKLLPGYSRHEGYLLQAICTEIKQLKGQHSDASEYVSRLRQLLKKIRKLVSSVPSAPPATGFPDSKHDSVAVGYVEWLAREFVNLQARVSELEQQSIHRYRETATNDEWLFLPEDRNGCVTGLRVRDKYPFVFAAVTVASRFTPAPIPPADDAPIVSFPGAFVCWDAEDRQYTAWKDPEDDEDDIGFNVLRNDGHFDSWYSKGAFENAFTRTKPITLPPDREAWLDKIKHLVSNVDEARRELAEVKG